MTIFRSLLFNLLLWIWTAIAVIGFVPLLLGPARWAVKAQSGWSTGAEWLIRHVVGITWRERDRENLPEGPVIVACKHQSVYETIVMQMRLRDPAIVMKRELLNIPLYGWYSRRMGMIPIDRNASSSAMRQMLRAAEAAVAQGRPILIFPEGTRAAPGAPAHYHPGVAGLYRHLKVPVVPVALNSGLFWGRNTVHKHAGTVTLQYLPVIEPGLDRRAFMAEMEERIETATAALLEESGFCG
ncbi:lysophospholipid acyltransferase family protein [Emcibacter sp. SYSU 3D8]|uniref:lysophospholipid acyltransferase family protein n=1 Tax=Emcibacter sp. SYSU 3D8 TaxID=3133969 RepID=UPI0031FEF04E